MSRKKPKKAICTNKPIVMSFSPSLMRDRLSEAKSPPPELSKRNDKISAVTRILVRNLTGMNEYFCASSITTMRPKDM